MPRKPTSHVHRRLSRRQLEAIDLLEAGFTVAETASLMRTGMATLRAWLRWEPGFLAELNRRQDERTKRLIREEIRGAMRKAVRNRLARPQLEALEQVLDKLVRDRW